MIFCYTHRSVSCSTIIKEASSCSRGEQTQRLDDMQKTTDLGTASPKWDVSIKSLPSELGESRRTGSGNMVRAGEDGGPRKQGPPNLHDQCSHELTCPEQACSMSSTWLLHVLYLAVTASSFVFSCSSGVCE